MDIALPNKFFEYSACGKPIIMRPIPDVARIGGPNLFVYRTRDEFITHVKNLMEKACSLFISTWKTTVGRRKHAILNPYFQDYCP